MRPRCDPFDVSAVRTAIASGETTAMARIDPTPARRHDLMRGRLGNRWCGRGDPRNRVNFRPQGFSSVKERPPVKPSNVLTLTGDSVSLSVKRGALIAARDAMTLVYEPRAVKPSAIVMTGWGGVITLAALRFCAKHRIAVVILDWDRDFMTAMALPARRAARVARAQLEAILPSRALLIAKELIAAKIGAHTRLGAMPETKAQAAIERVRTADTERALLMLEAQAARLAWADRPIVMKWREAGYIPPSWKLPFSQRRRLDRKFSRHATDPINALLNLGAGGHDRQVGGRSHSPRFQPCDRRSAQEPALATRL